MLIDVYKYIIKSIKSMCAIQYTAASTVTSNYILRPSVA